MDNLAVYYKQQIVGSLSINGTETYTFSHTDEWLSSPDSFPISLQRPFTQKTFTKNEARWFFANLLPEGRVRSLVCRRFGISEENDFELLKAIGGECAGALRIVPEDRIAYQGRKNDYRPVSLEKSVSLLYGMEKKISLAPFYDLVCTAVYPGIDRPCAMAIGGCFDPGQIYERHWRTCAKHLSIRFSFLRDMVRTLCDTLRESLQPLSEQFTRTYGSSPMISMIAQSVQKRIRRVKGNLSR